MTQRLLLLACGFAAALGSSTAMASVDNAKAAIAIANQVCSHMGGLQPVGGLKISDWHARLDGDRWKVMTRAVMIGVEGRSLVVLVPKNGPLPTRCPHNVMD